MRLPKFKKKIALLLRDVLRESREFASAFTAVVERRRDIAGAREDDELQESAQSQVLDSSTAEFKAALEKIPTSLLELFQRQFHAEPTALVVGGIAPDEVKKEKVAEIEATSFDEDIESLEEDESE